jgi:hypothetical protein
VRVWDFDGGKRKAVRGLHLGDRQGNSRKGGGEIKVSILHYVPHYRFILPRNVCLRSLWEKIQRNQRGNDPKRNKERIPLKRTHFWDKCLSFLLQKKKLREGAETLF